MVKLKDKKSFRNETSGKCFEIAIVEKGVHNLVLINLPGVYGDVRAVVNLQTLRATSQDTRRKP